MRVLVFGIMVTLITACVTTGSNPSNNKLADAHQWSQPERQILNDLRLFSTVDRIDNSNRVVNNPDAINLGHKLFFATQFSRNGKISCASCHQPDKHFTDGLPQSVGLQQVIRNAPTIVGASQHNWFFLDGRADSLWAQAMGPIENPLEHGSSRNQVVHEIAASDELRQAYEKVYGKLPDLSDRSRFPYHAGPIKGDVAASNAWRRMQKQDQRLITDVFVNAAKALAAYETRLQPGKSRFDQYATAVIKDKRQQLSQIYSEDEANGLKLFMGKAMCTICHNGPHFSDLEFHNIATPPLNVKRYDFGRRKGVHQVKRSPFNCKGVYNDAPEPDCRELAYMIIDDHETMAAFKTPSLRNVSKTGPYMHAGQYATLSEVIKHYVDTPPTLVGSSDLLNIDLNAAEMRQLEAFLRTLDSDINAPAALLRSP